MAGSRFAVETKGATSINDRGPRGSVLDSVADPGPR